VHAVGGFTNRSLPAHVAAVLGTDYAQSQTSYNLPAPRGALSYPQRTWEELEGSSLGLMAYVEHLPAIR
jgi:hypothetical protein